MRRGRLKTRFRFSDGLCFVCRVCGASHARGFCLATVFRRQMKREAV
ncbi:hypothetical protein HMPREF9123_0416 [Neisseria bacilliformis ATCC BAA-1200]|uniref:Uncharacterized protein n=1 Tax=Neisseria bacilliformis ATCC BAA-1200 TaxID=888742 RepID=F2B9H0_9NEIS|nr:hypothetical protein HMPREF9123_0416 [Neisseria bacilliformis ATCC BAA-1200]